MTAVAFVVWYIAVMLPFAFYWTTVMMFINWWEDRYNVNSNERKYND